ncbi:mucin-2-like isoform X1 [Octopus vulgaris]|uniref:Mucin-2-like isoform X1 n=1 Tax=Octopus vulgaris TaxID=6645 RepID=A0AA36BZ03_OCTVU|nr:mucin-2-like isoform X1 [Octopus vulgaris]
MKVIISAYGVTITLDGSQISVNDEINPVLPYLSRYIYVKKATHQFVLVEGFGFRVLFNPNHQLYIKLYPFFENKIQGLCGRFNYKRADEITGKNGAPETVEKFLEIYKDRTCADPARKLGDPCTDFYYAKENAEATCYGCEPDSGLQYLECASSCNGNCRDKELQNPSCEEECVPGCACPPDSNTVLNNNMKCVGTDKCPCYDKLNGNKIYEAGSIMRRKCTNWEPVSHQTSVLAPIKENGTRVYLHLNKTWRNEVEGLCGNYNGDTEDDFASPDGMLLSKASSFGHSWRINDCPKINQDKPADKFSPCEGNKRRFWAEESCSIIMGPLFKACRETISEDKARIYHKDCMDDACGCDSGGDCECLCTAIANFVEECNKNGHHVKWRHQHLCPIQCENGFKYVSCGPPCQATCRNIGDEPEKFCESTHCIEGCFCPAGYVQEVLVPMGNSNASSPIVQQHAKQTRRSAKMATVLIPSTNAMVAWIAETVRMNTTACKGNEFVCGSGKCISNEFVCDGMFDCLDQTDEMDCQIKCSGNEFACDSGRCIPAKFSCDGEFDCGPGDRSDESNCVVIKCKNPRHFRCGSGKCLPLPVRCDGHDDCGDGSDEIDCNCTCSDKEFTCKSCDCIPAQKLCDGVPDCPHEDDELCRCNPGEFTCSNGECIDNAKICDGEPDCNDTLDEQICLINKTTPYPSEYTSQFLQTTEITTKIPTIVGTTPITSPIPVISTTIPVISTVMSTTEGKACVDTNGLSSTTYIKDEWIQTTDNTVPGYRLRPLGAQGRHGDEVFESSAPLLVITVQLSENYDVSLGSLQLIVHKNIKSFMIMFRKVEADHYMPFGKQFSATDSVHFPTGFQAHRIQIFITDRFDVGKSVTILLDIHGCFEPVFLFVILHILVFLEEKFFSPDYLL